MATTVWSNWICLWFDAHHSSQSAKSRWSAPSYDQNGVAHGHCTSPEAAYIPRPSLSSALLGSCETPPPGFLHTLCSRHSAQKERISIRGSSQPASELCSLKLKHGYSINTAANFMLAKVDTNELLLSISNYYKTPIRNFHPFLHNIRGHKPEGKSHMGPNLWSGGAWPPSTCHRFCTATGTCPKSCIQLAPNSHLSSSQFYWSWCCEQPAISVAQPPQVPRLLSSLVPCLEQ